MAKKRKSSNTNTILFSCTFERWAPFGISNMLIWKLRRSPFLERDFTELCITMHENSQQCVRKWKFVQLNLELARATRQCTATSVLPIISCFILNGSCLSSQSLFYCCHHLCRASVLTFDVTNLVAQVLKQWQTPEKRTKKAVYLCVCVRAVASPETFDLYPASVCVWHPLTPCVPG